MSHPVSREPVFVDFEMDSEGRETWVLGHKNSKGTDYVRLYSAEQADRMVETLIERHEQAKRMRKARNQR